MQLCPTELEIFGTVVQISLMDPSCSNLIIFKTKKTQLDYTNFVSSRIITLILISSAPSPTAPLPLQQEG